MDLDPRFEVFFFTFFLRTQTVHFYLCTYENTRIFFVCFYKYFPNSIEIPCKMFSLKFSAFQNRIT